MKNVKTVVIIGGGMAGLSAGCFLAQKGFNVKLFEANDKVGGACATTTIKGFTFNDGALYLALPGILDHVFERLQIDCAAHLPLRKITAVQTTILPDGTIIILGERNELSVNGRAATPSLQRELHDLTKKWNPVLRFFADDILIHPFFLPRLMTKGWRHLFKLRGTVAAELEALIRDKSLRAALAGALLFTGVPPENQSLLSILGLISMLSEGLYLPEGGMGKIPELIHQTLQQRGGEIFLNAKVTQIVVRNCRTCGVQVAGQGLVEADAILSTVSGMATFGLLLNPEDVPRKMRRKAQTAPLSHQAVSIQLGLANRIDAPSHLNAVLPWMPEQYKIFTGDGGAKWPSYSVPTVTMPELAPAGGSIVELYVPVIVHPQEAEWDPQKTEHITESAIETLSRYHHLDIVAKRVRTPKDFQQEMHLYHGAVYGLSPAANPRAQFPHKTPLPGLFLAGQTTYPGFGVGSAALSGIFAAELVD